MRDIISGLTYLHAHDGNDELRRSPGTPVFTAPECCLGLTYHGKASDTWAVGVTLYYMILGEYPFLGDTLQDTYERIVNNPIEIPDDINPQLKNLIEGLLCKVTEQGIFKQILQGRLDFQSEPWPGISDSAKDLIRKMLDRNPKNRFTAHQVLCHPWIVDDNIAPDEPLDSAVLTRLKQFSAMNKLKKDGFTYKASGNLFRFYEQDMNPTGIEIAYLEVVNPKGGTEDAEEEANKGRWKEEERDSYWKMMQRYVGSDITSMVTLPVIIFEPMTMIQKMAELMEYSYLLDMADETDDPYMRLVYASSFFISVYYAYQRTWKPFNPILGETYEMANHGGMSFIAEQVSHHPPMSAGHAENEHFTYDVTSKLKTKFLGNSVDVYPVGRTRVTLKRDGVTLDLVPPPTKVSNLIFGRTWIDSPGEMVLTNLTTGDKVVLYFQPCGWFGAGRYEVDGYVYNAAEEPKILITGKWNESLSYQVCDPEGEPLPGTELKEVWKVAEVPKKDKFQYTYFAHKLNSFDTAPKKLLASDSRLRPDRLALEKGDLSVSGHEKSSLEERQRAEKRNREAKNQKFIPRWFDLTEEVTPTPWGELEVYQYNGKYTEHRAAIDSSDCIEESDSRPEFNPWQFDNLEAE